MQLLQNVLSCLQLLLTDACRHGGGMHCAARCAALTAVVAAGSVVCKHVAFRALESAAQQVSIFMTNAAVPSSYSVVRCCLGFVPLVLCCPASIDVATAMPRAELGLTIHARVPRCNSIIVLQR